MLKAEVIIYNNVGGHLCYVFAFEPPLSVTCLSGQLQTSSDTFSCLTNDSKKQFQLEFFGFVNSRLQKDLI